MHATEATATKITAWTVQRAVLEETRDGLGGFWKETGDWIVHQEVNANLCKSFARIKIFIWKINIGLSKNTFMK